MDGLSMIFVAIGLIMFANLHRRNRTFSPIPVSVYDKNVWIKTTSGKTLRKVPYYIAIKIRQRLGGEITFS